MTPEVLQAVALTVVTAATPLLLAAIGELVTERAGVLNLGVEGMMIVGAVLAFAAAQGAGSALAGVVAGALGGAALALLFAALTLGLAANQIAVGLAITLLGLGLAGLIGQPFIGAPGVKLAPIEIPVLIDQPLIGRLLFGQDVLVYLSLALTAGVAWMLARSRAGLVLRAVGDNAEAAHAVGIKVRRVRLLAVLFGGLCAGLGGAYLSLVYTPLWSEGMTAGRGWIAVALVVFAGWRPWRALTGAYVFGGVLILQLHLQAAGVALPSQLLSALPYLATILALVLLSRDRRRLAASTPAALGHPFTPGR